jgi:flagella basal body P-ring formation protein FlgA
LVLWAACGLAIAGTPVTIALRPQARVTGPTVTLGDVAVLSASELEPLRMLVNLALGRAPAGGETVLVHRDALAGWVRARAGLAGDAVRWGGPPTVQLITATRRIGGEEIASAAESALREWLATHSQRSEPELQLLPRDVETPEGELRLQARALDAVALRSRMVVWVEVWVGDRFVRAVAVPFRVSAWPPSPTLLQAMAVDAPVTLAPPEAKVAPPIAARGAPVLAVQRGQWASLRSGAGAVTSEARVEVLQDGRLGDSVRVRQPGAASGLIARVTGPGQLEVAR